MEARERINVIIGTAGHVDHGKTQLVRALTGVNTDRLKEEKERGISIELGFAPFVLPNGKLAGIVDVPGHERFVKQMVAGAGGMDLVMLVIAADEGIMPQTREHLDVLELLQVPRGIVVLTKSDLVEEDWLELITEEIKESLEGSILEDAPIIAVSSVTGEGIEDLKKMIVEKVETLPKRPTAGAARLPIDRVFTISGFGTVATGTLVSGSLHVGDQMVLMPRELPVRVRGLQVHGEKVEHAAAGQRVAVNLHGIEISEVERGDVLATPNSLTPSYRVSVRLQVLDRGDKPIKERERIRFHVGTRETLGRVSLLDREELAPGEEAFAQIVLEEPVVVLKGDRFVLRSYSPAITIGGGRVIEGLAAKLKKNRSEVLEALATKEKGSPAERLSQHLAHTGLPISPDEAAKTMSMTKDEVAKILTKIKAGENLGVALLEGEGTTFFISSTKLDFLEKSMLSEVESFHQTYPLRRGMPKDDLKGKLVAKWGTKAYAALLSTLQQRGTISVSGNVLAVADYSNQPALEVKKKIEMLEDWFVAGGAQPPTPAEAKERLIKELCVEAKDADEYLAYLVDQGRLAKIGEDLFFHSEALSAFRQTVVKALEDKGEVAVADIRDVTNSSRRYIVPLLEWLDRERVTRRVGDKRVLFQRRDS